MKQLTRDVLKAGAVMFAVGFLLATAAPAIAAWVGVEAAALGITANPLWLGAFFAGFGAINAAVAPAFDSLFGDKPKSAASTPPPIRDAQAPTPSFTVEQDVTPERAAEPKYRETVNAGRGGCKDSNILPGR